MSRVVKEVIKRDGRLEPFDIERVITSITWALEETGEGTRRTAEYLAKKVVEQLPKVASVEAIQDKIVETLRTEGYSKTADAFSDYRKRHEELRALRSVAFDTGKWFRTTSNSGTGGFERTPTSPPPTLG
jgi:ribonucleoside-triphosphate reductase